MSSFWEKPIRNIIGSNASEKITSEIDNLLDHAGLLQYKDIIEAAAVAYLAGGGKILGQSLQLGGDVGNIQALLKTTKGQALLNATVSQMLTGDPKNALMFSALGSTLSSIPGGVGQFFNSDIGKTLTGLFIGGGGKSGLFGGTFGNLFGDIGDNLGDIATYAALAFAGKEFAKDAISRSNELNTQEKGVVDQLVSNAQKLSTPEYQESVIQKSLENVNRETQASKESAERELYGRGLGLRTAGAVGRIGSDAAKTRAATRRDLSVQLPLAATQALSAASGPLQTAAERAEKTAAEESRMPLDFYMSMKNANRATPMDQYYANLNQQLQQQNQQAQIGSLLSRIGGLLGGGSSTGSVAANAGTNPAITNPTASGTILNPFAWLSTMRKY